MNQEESQTVIIILLASILVAVGVIAWAVAAPQSFQDITARMNEPMPNIYDAIQGAAQQAGNGDINIVMRIVYPTVGVVGVGAVVFWFYEFGKKEKTSNTVPMERKQE
jgi:hypothetical protein